MFQLVLYLIVLGVSFVSLWFESFIVKCVIFLPFLLISGWTVMQNNMKYYSAFSIASLIVISLNLLGALWREYISFAVIIVYGFSIFVSVFSIVAYMFFVHSRKKHEKEIRIERKREKTTIISEIKLIKLKIEKNISLVKRAFGHKKAGKTWLLSFQLAYCETLEFKQNDKNAIDFSFLKVVDYERNEYDLSNK